VDAIAKNQSTDIYGNITTFAESKLDANLLYAGTDDGLLHVTTDSGQNWTKIDANGIAGVPERTYVNQIIASQHDKNVVYATFNHHRYGDFKPYVYKSTDMGKTWTALQNNLPERGTVYTIAEDHVNANLLFVGTEFGLFVSIDGGQKWSQIKGGLPTIAVRDLDIQKRENDLVLATFGRGFYVLDDYSPLRNLQNVITNTPSGGQGAGIFGIKDAWQFNPAQPLGLRGKGFQGESYFATANPTVGSVFTYYLKDDLKTLKEKRKEREKALIKDNKDVPYPSIDSLRLEDNQPAPYLLFTITDAEGNTVRRLKAPAKKGLHRLTWDFRYDAPDPVNFNEPDPMNFFSGPDLGPMALAGDYKVSMSKFEDGQITELVPAQPFKVVSLNTVTLPAADKKALAVFSKKAMSLARATGSAQSVYGDLNNKMRYLKAAWQSTAGASVDLQTQISGIEKQLLGISTLLFGDRTLSRREFETPTSMLEKAYRITGNLIGTSAAPTQTMQAAYQSLSKQLTTVVADLKKTQTDVAALETALDRAGAPATPGRLIDWKEN
nr:glycosyl hydrolase [Spirosomataceae bacterium]